MSLALEPDTVAHAKAIGELLAEFGRRYDVDVPEHWADLWWTEFHKVPIETLRRARDAFFAAEATWPAGGRWKDYVADAKAWQQAQRTGTGMCCDRGWVHVASGSYPCRTCRPEQHETWRRSWAPAARKMELIRPDTVLTFNPRACVDQAKQLLHANDRRNP